MLTKEKLSEYINKGIIDKIGHAAFSLLSVIVEIAKQKGYPEILRISVKELLYKARFNNYNHLKDSRDRLKEAGLIKDYKNENKSEMGTFFLKYE